MWTVLSSVLSFSEKAWLAIANCLLFVMVMINLVNIISRLLFDIGLIWVFPWTTVLFVWTVFFSFYVIYRRAQDISVDVLVRGLSPALARAAKLFTYAVTLVLMVIICAQAPTLLPRQVGNMDFVGLDRYWMSVPLYISAFLIVLDLVSKMRVELLSDASNETHT